METRRLTCGHCGTPNLVATCSCGRAFVLTLERIAGRARAFDDQPVQQLPASFTEAQCDYCSAKARGEDPRVALNAGLRQKTCPVCHQEFLSQHGL
jgi:hypothetical protein